MILWVPWVTDVKPLVQGYRAKKWSNQDLNPGLLTPDFAFFQIEENFIK